MAVISRNAGRKPCDAVSVEFNGTGAFEDMELNLLPADKTAQPFEHISSKLDPCDLELDSCQMASNHAAFCRERPREWIRTGQYIKH